ncbi:PTS system mannose/fructose/N-acetylgalactosamine-transporter subunit IIB [Jiangella alkaliphila]|uniref:PTS system, mannose-specific IIB component n=1 Tax=Jiangella alkaliphila TaxID=419479 RepID=A0A1H2JWY3_9ACTN|nr:PTS sugar transporter subunit IIB [Jiangella alkaliphila]SDU60964.1 PTS system, mannose-specific IIB component [Jiangella alkaliphila]
MDIALIRVDDRLIHGQVVMGWTQALGIQQILVADDPTAANPTQKNLMLLAVPAGVRADILTIADSARIVEQSTSDVKTIVVVKGPAELKALYDAGLKMTEVNVGNVHTGPGRRRLTKEVHATDDEIAIWRELSAKGVHLEAQWLPGAARTDLGKLVADLPL